MTNDTEMRPAMTPDEWQQLSTAGDNLGRGEGRVFLNGDGLHCTAEAGFTWATVVNRHGTAALALHDQPFGFSLADVRMLHEIERRLFTTQGYDDLFPRDLADRIAALLPPE